MNEKELQMETMLRRAIISEYEAIEQYESFANLLDDKTIQNTLRDIAKEERQHVGELESLLAKILPKEQKQIEEGKNEFNKKFASIIDKVMIASDVFGDFSDISILNEIAKHIKSFKSKQLNITDIKTNKSLEAIVVMFEDSIMKVEGKVVLGFFLPKEKNKVGVHYTIFRDKNEYKEGLQKIDYSNNLATIADKTMNLVVSKL